FNQVKRLDPHEAEAEGGLKLVKALREGKIKAKDLLNRDNRADVRVERDAKGNVRIRREQMKDMLARLQADDQVPAPEAKPAAPDVDADSPLKQQQLRLTIAQQRAAGIVEDALRRARRLKNTDPEAAKDLLKSVLSSIQDDPDLQDTRTEGVLTDRLTTELRAVEARAVVVQREQEEAMRRRAALQSRLTAESGLAALEERTKERMRVFHNLMDQARYLDAYRQALAIKQDAINTGNLVPVSVTASYYQGLVSTNLRELQELRRRREERYLLTMMQVERSHVPFPDEPPVEFPPAAVWRELTRVRKEKYESSGLFEEDAYTLAKVKRLRDLLNKPITVDFPPGSTIKDAVDYLQDRYGATILIDEQAWKDDPDLKDQFPEGILNQPVKLPKMVGISMATVLRLLFEPVGGTYLVRRDFIEITTARIQAAEKTLRVYPVADLVIPIPNGVNQQGLQQNLQVAGQSLTVNGQGVIGQLGGAGFGGGLGGLGGLGVLGGIGGGLAGLGGIGGLGGGLGGLGGGLGGLGGGLGGLGGAGIGGLGAGGMGGAGFGGGNFGMAGGGAQNMGFGGGMFGIGGGQQGQFGNLGGQFGLQGGDTSIQLIRLITQVVGTPKDWVAPPRQLGQQAGGLDEDKDTDIYGTGTAGQIGYYQTARALMVKATSRIHTSVTSGMSKPKAGADLDKGAALDREDRGERVVRGTLERPRKEDVRVAAAGDGRDDKDPRKNKVRRTAPATPVADLDARKIWQDALAKGVNDPGLIIATADFLVQHEKWEHAAEFLKAALRRGIVGEPWVYESLALALKESKGSVVDIERADLSAVDLQPQDARGYLRASASMADLKHWDRAVAFCRQASLLDPGAPTPYAEALLYAEASEDPQAMEWAAGNILSRDWPADNQKLHDEAREKLRALRMDGKFEQMRQRDLVIRLSWQGEADLDLQVKEPIGTVCSFMHRQTPGGGTLLGDTTSDSAQQSYVAAEAFPGQYEVTVRRIWGRPLGSKATLRIIEHQGTPDETEHRETVTLDRKATVKFTLDTGRRTSSAQVSPEASQPRAARANDNVSSGANVFSKLRALANPDQDMSFSGMQGGVTSLGVQIESTPPDKPADPSPADQVAYQSKVAPFVPNSLDLTAQATVSADRRFVRLSLAPVFNTVTTVQPAPVTVFVPMIPGGR
ncbi:MAG TPA: hypothetical protein VG013_31405, partial [Gemmataceae bacterium]|nr:hypothetical protein [Gemmataceae bacterium]